MLGIETRLNLTSSERAELVKLCSSFQRTAQSAYQALKKNPALNITKFAQSKGLTNHQAKSIQTQVETWFLQDRTQTQEQIKVFEHAQAGLQKKLG